MPGKKKLLWTAFKVVLAAGLILLLFTRAKVSVGGIVRALESVNVWWLLLAVSLHIPGNVISVIRWRLLARVQGDHHSFGYLLRSYLVGQFFNNFLPTRYGGDVVRIWDGSRQSKSLVKSSAIVVVDRATGLIALFLFALLASLFRLDFAQKLPVIWVSLLVGVCGLVAVTVFFLPLTGRLLGKLPAKGVLAKGLQKLLTFRQVLISYKDHKGPFAVAMVWAVVLQVNVVIYYFLMGKAFHLNVPLFDFFIFIPIVLLIQTIPVLLGGLGGRELAYVAIFAYYGIASSLAVSYSLVADVAVNLFIGLIGGVIYVSRK